MSDSKAFINKLKTDPAMNAKALKALEGVAKDAGSSLNTSELESIAGGGGCHEYVFTAYCTP